MKLGKLYLIAVLVGTLAVIGCGDDGSSNGGSGGTAGGGGDTGFVCDADVICAECPEGRETFLHAIPSTPVAASRA
jgi:hypothetical protein